MTEVIGGLLVPVDATARWAGLPRPDRETLNALYGLIGCSSVSVVAVCREVHMWVDEDGPCTRREVNPLASYIAAQLGEAYTIIGPAVLTGGADSHGQTMSLSDEARGRIMAYIAEWYVARMVQP